jgi:hypothetical protein
MYIASTYLFYTYLTLPCLYPTYITAPKLDKFYNYDKYD